MAKDIETKNKKTLFASATSAGRKLYYMGFAMLIMLASSPVFANDGAFEEFSDAIIAFAHGPFGIGISVLALILGAVFGLAKMTAWPALTGLAVAAVLAIGPYMIKQVFDMFIIT